MKLFELFENWNQSKTLRFDPKFEDYVPTFGYKVSQQIEKGVQPKIAHIKPTEVYATQDWISEFGGGDPAFPEYEDHPVLVKTQGKIFILDGHHRFHEAFKGNYPVKSYLFSI